ATATGAVATGRRAAALVAFEFGARGQDGLAGQPDLAHVVDLQHFHFDRVAFLHGVFDLRDALNVELADVAEAFAAREDLHERAELLDRDHFALVDLADLGFSGHE